MALSEAEAKKHSVDTVYAKANGANSEITFDAEVDKKRIPVTTKNYGREENHFEFGKAVFQETKESE